MFRTDGGDAQHEGSGRKRFPELVRQPSIPTLYLPAVTHDRDVRVSRKRFCEGISDTVCDNGIGNNMWNSAFLQVLEYKVNH